MIEFEKVTEQDVENFIAGKYGNIIPDDIFTVSDEDWEALEQAYRSTSSVERLKSVSDIIGILDVITKSIRLSRSMASWDIGAKFMKLQEEMGELAEVALYENGFNQHKAKPNEDSFGEGADVILCVLDVLSRLHLELTPHQVHHALALALSTKYKKWEKRILEMERKTNDRSNEDQQLPSDDK